MFLARAPISLGLSAYGLQQQRLWLLLVAPLLMVPFALLFPTAWGVPFVPLLQLGPDLVCALPLAQARLEPLGTVYGGDGRGGLRDLVLIAPLSRRAVPPRRWAGSGTVCRIVTSQDEQDYVDLQSDV
jgi:hypothetical protein